MSGAARHLEPTVAPGYSALSPLEPARRAVVEEALRPAPARTVYRDARDILQAARDAAAEQRPTTLAALREIVQEHAAVALYGASTARDRFEEAVADVRLRGDPRSVPIGYVRDERPTSLEWRPYTLARGLLLLEVAADDWAFLEWDGAGNVSGRLDLKLLRARERVIAAEVAA